MHIGNKEKGSCSSKIIKYLTKQLNSTWFVNTYDFGDQRTQVFHLLKSYYSL